MTTYVPAKKGAEFIFYAGLVSQSTGQFQANPTLAAGDFKVSIDGGALNNLATLPAVTPASSRMVKFTLSTSEMNGDNITVVGADAAGAEWDEIIVSIQTSAQQIDDLATQTSVNTIDDFLDTEVAAIKAKTDNLPSDPADASDIATSFTTVNSKLDAIDDFIDTEIANIQSRLPAALSGDGYMKSDLKSIDDELTSGNNATLNLKQMSIQNSSGDAFIAQSTDGNGYGIKAIGHGTGNGIVASAQSGSGEYGLRILGDYGLGIQGNTGEGIFVSGELSAVTFEGSAPDGNALNLIASGSGKSINALSDIAVSDGNLTLAAIANSVWTNATRTLTAISDSAGITTLLSRVASALNISSGKVEANVKQINGTNVTGDGSSGDPWGPA